MQSFDPYDENCYFFKDLSRHGANELLKFCEIGTFLIRNSTSDPTNFSLSLRVSESEENCVRHYFLERKEHDSGKFYIFMNGNEFVDIPGLICFYMREPLGVVSLTKPAPKKTLFKVSGVHRFNGERITDLPFDIDETLEILSKPEEEWWLARNVLGHLGLVPVNYVEKIEA